MSAMIKAITSVRLPFSRTTLLIAGACMFAFVAFVALGLRF